MVASLRATFALLAFTLGCGCSTTGDAIEAACIKGQLSSLQAEAVNTFGPKKREPGYCLGQTYTDDEGVQREGFAHCEAEEGDRLLSASCAGALKVYQTGD